MLFKKLLPLSMFAALTLGAQGNSNVKESLPPKAIESPQGKQYALVMRAGFNHVPPDSMYINGNPVGPAIEYLQFIGASMGVSQTQFVKMPLARIVQGITSNTIDCVPRIGGRGYPDSFVYAAMPFSFSYPGLLVSAKSKLAEISSAKDLSGMTVATKLKMPLTASLEGADVRWEWVGAQNPLENAIRMLAAGRVDAVYSPSLAELIFMAGDLKLFDQVKPIRLPDEPWPVFVAFSKTGASKFKAQYDTLNEKFQKEGKYQEMFDAFAAQQFKEKGIDLKYLELIRPAVAILEEPSSPPTTR